MERSDDYMAKIMMDALDRSVILDAQINITHNGPKLKAYCVNTKTYVQFPRDLRREGATFYADVVKMSNGGKIFFRAYKGSIRRSKAGEIIA